MFSCRTFGLICDNFQLVPQVIEAVTGHTTSSSTLKPYALPWNLENARATISFFRMVPRYKLPVLTALAWERLLILFLTKQIMVVLNQLMIKYIESNWHVRNFETEIWRLKRKIIIGAYGHEAKARRSRTWHGLHRSMMRVGAHRCCSPLCLAMQPINYCEM